MILDAIMLTYFTIVRHVLSMVNDQFMSEVHNRKLKFNHSLVTSGKCNVH